MPLADLNKTELEALLSGLGEPKYRVRQVYEWLNKGARPEEMSSLPAKLREELARIPYGGVEIERKFVSGQDGTVKYLFRLADENLVEGVLMRYHYGNTLCLSTQVGCAMGCKFCASTLEGCVRNLSVGELLGQIHAVERDEPAKEPGHRTVTNLVLMGSGEPLDNYDNVVAFLNRVTAQDGLRISPRNISVSTCGIVPKIDAFFKDAPHVTLSISLHAHDDETRTSLMPINKVYPIGEVIAAAKRYADQTGRRVVFEYALIGGVNSSLSDADSLSARLRGILCHVNLIPLNPVPERGLSGVSRTEAERFCQRLAERNISATIRREMGTDIEGACGQLRRRILHEIRSENGNR
ncbi:MAG: 23S rRNA (adenine(2503)-C(2))-methyltransferase RlmN [Eubacteriales bacterium]|nr:23S rRNA (adenine(2503)-C(2))-methyltransferase RlmN [Eubacteriales bacterium]